MAEVVPLFDGDVAPGEADPEVVERLEQLLDRARRGEVVGIAYALALGSGKAGHGWQVSQGARFVASAGLMALVHRFGEALDNG